MGYVSEYRTVHEIDTVMANNGNVNLGMFLRSIRCPRVLRWPPITWLMI